MTTHLHLIPARLAILLLVLLAAAPARAQVSPFSTVSGAQITEGTASAELNVVQKQPGPPALTLQTYPPITH